MYKRQVDVPAVDTDATVNFDGSKADVEIPEASATLPETEAQASIDGRLPGVSPDLQADFNADKPTPEFTVAGLVPSADDSLEDNIDADKTEQGIPDVEFTAPSLGLQVGASSPEVDVPAVDTDAKVDFDGGKADVEIPEANLPETNVSLPDVSAEPQLSFSVNQPTEDVPASVRLPAGELHAQPDAAADVTAPDIDGKASVPEATELDIVPGVRLDRDASDLPDTEPHEIRLEANVDDDIDVKASAPQLHSEPPSDGGSWFDPAPTLQVERRVERAELFQKHGYAILVTSAMLKRGESVHDDLDDKFGDRSHHDQEDDAKSSSSGDSSDRLSGQYYFGMNSSNVDDSARSDGVVNGEYSAGIGGGVSGGLSDSQSRLEGTGEDEHPSLTNGMRLQQQGDASRDIVVTAGVRRTKDHSSEA